MTMPEILDAIQRGVERNARSIDIIALVDEARREHNRQMDESGRALARLAADRDNWRRQALDENAVVDKLKEGE